MEQNNKYCIDSEKVNLQQYCSSNTQKFTVWIKREHYHCIIFKLFLNFSDSEREYSNKLYPYEKKCVLSKHLLLTSLLELT